MRVVSQDLTCDVPYDSVVISISITHPNEIVAYPSMNVLDRKGYWRIATYSNTEKVKKAMEMLREEYQKYYSNNGGGMMATDNLYIQPFAFNHPKVFQFPQDEEIEV